MPKAPQYWLAMCVYLIAIVMGMSIAREQLWLSLCCILVNIPFLVAIERLSKNGNR